MSEAAFMELLDSEQVSKDMDIDCTDLTTAMQRHSALYAHYANIAVRCKNQADRMKQQLELVESVLDGEYRSTMREANPKVTEAQIKAAIIKDARRRKAHQMAIDADTQYRMAQNVERAFEHRKDMLLMIARGQLREAEGQLRVSLNQGAQDARTRVLKAMQRNGQGDSAGETLPD